MTEAVLVQNTVTTTPSVGAAGGSKAAGTVSAAADVGSKTLATRNDNAATAQPGSNGQYVGLSADQYGALITRERAASAISKQNVTAAAVDTLLLAANPARRGVTIINRGTTVLSIDITGAVATIPTATHDLQIGAQMELPKPVPLGIIKGIWAGAPTGNAIVTETT